MPERLDRFPSDDVLIEDPHCGVLIHAGVPDVLRVYDHHRPVTALVHAPGVIHAHDPLQPALDDTLLQDLVHFLRTLRGARFSRGTYEDVMAILAHEKGEGRWEICEATVSFTSDNEATNGGA